MLLRMILRSLSNGRYVRRSRARYDVEVLESRVFPAAITVTTLDDVVASDGQTSLREAIRLANEDVDHDTIVFDDSLFTEFGSTIVLGAEGDIDITSSLTISAPENQTLAIDAQHLSRIFTINDLNEVNSSTITLRRLRLQNGAAEGTGFAGDGGAILTFDNLNLEETAIRNSGAAGRGGGIAALNHTDSGTVVVSVDQQSSIQGNSASSGGGIYADRNGLSGVVIRDSRIGNNLARNGDGGGIFGSNIGIHNSIVDGNAAFDVPLGISPGANGLGGGVYSEGLVAVSGTTFESNVAEVGGGIMAIGASRTAVPVVVRASLFVHNQADKNGGAISSELGIVSIADSTLVNNRVTDDYEPLTSSGAPNTNYPRGGAVSSFDGVRITNSTILRNRAHRAGAVYVSPEHGGELVLHNSIVAGNNDGELGFYSQGLRVSNHNIFGNVSSTSSFNIVGDSWFSASNGNQYLPLSGRGDRQDWRLVVENDGTEPVLAYNGGQTRTVALKSGSPAIDRGANERTNSGSDVTDQRGSGYRRVVASLGTQAIVDIGAFEKQAAGPHIHTATVSEFGYHVAWDRVANVAGYEVSVVEVGTLNADFSSQVSQFRTESRSMALGRYRFSVRAVLDDGTKSEWSVKEAHVDYRPVVRSILVSDGDNVVPRFEWQPVPGAVHYRIYFRNDTAAMLLSTLTTSETYFQADTPLEFGYHDFWVRAISEGGFQSTWSERTREYRGPQLIGPRGSSFTEGLHFKWEAIRGVASYRLYVTNGRSKVLDVSGLTASSYRPETAFPQGRYRWWVLPTHDSGRNGRWTGVGEFRTDGRPEGLYPLPAVSPPTLGWSAVEGAVDYEVYVSAHGIVSRYRSVTHPELQLHPSMSTSYEVWVRARRSDGTYGPWSSKLEFDDIAASTFAAPLVDKPIEVTAPGVLEFVWSSIDSAASYQVHVRTARQGGELSQTTLDAVIPANRLAYSFDASDLSADTVVEWYVRALDVTGSIRGDWSSGFVYLDQRVQLISPLIVTEGPRPIFQWSSVVGFERYEIYIEDVLRGEDPLFRRVVQGISDGEVVRYQLPVDLAIGSYRFWIRGFGVNSGPWSRAGTFDLV